ncbi:MAG: hypothetical protein DHS20C17_06190 [Cyclobacteriaceae bacterium]|nr:MAG: hypothetical protein DHS20C17_06190 [Cyclobacteriaceae bacterium]
MPVKTSGYIFLTGTVDKSYQYRYHQCLYHQEAYRNCQPEREDFCFWWGRSGSNEIHGTMYLYRESNKAISQLFAPFGGFDGVKLSVENANEFILAVIRSLCDQGIEHMEIRQPPACYGTQVWDEVLLNLGFKVKYLENHHLSISNVPFSTGLHPMERRKLSKSGKFKFEVNSIKSLPDIYNHIKSCRDERHQRLSMDYEQLSRVVKELPNHFLLCCVKYQNQIAASAIIIKVNPYCWYQFYPAHSSEFNKESPMVFLLSRLYDYAQSQGVRVLDLGTSELNGKPLEGLIKFKSRVGGKPGRKAIYTKALPPA